METFWTLQPRTLTMWDLQTPDEIVQAALRMGKRQKVSDGTQVTNEDIYEGEGSKAGGDEDVTKVNKLGTRSRVAGYAGREMEKWLHDNPGVVRLIGGPCCRKSVAASQKWHCEEYSKTLW